MPLLVQVKSYVESRIAADLGDMLPIPAQIRIKSPEACYSKLAKGDYESLIELDDLVGARVTVLHPAAIDDVASAIAGVFPVSERRNEDSPRPDDLKYRQLHLIVQLPADYTRRNPDLGKIKVEVQFTTYLQLALQETAHSSVYKAGEFSWLRARTAARMRGALELLDSLLETFETAPQAHSEPAYPLFDGRNRIVDLLRSVFAETELPADLRRLAVTVETITQTAGVDVDQLTEILENNTDLVHARSITPVEKILGCLLRDRNHTFIDKLNRSGRRYLVSGELESLCNEASAINQDVRVRLEVPGT